MAPTWQSSAWVDVSEEPGIVILRVCGEIDLNSRDVVQPAILAALPVSSNVVIDLSQVTFCDSSGIAMFLVAHEKAEAAQVMLEFGNVPPSVARVLNVSGVGRVLRVKDGSLI